MDTLFLICAVAGGAVLVIQTLLMLIGFTHEGDADVHGAEGEVHVEGGDAHGDGDGDHASEGLLFIKMLSLRTVVAFLTFFGLVGLICQDAGLKTHFTLPLAIGSGMAAFVAVYWAFAAIMGLQHKGNLDLRNAVGLPARVYLRIPGGTEKAGKITVDVQGRRIQVKACSDAPIATGAEVIVEALVSADMVKVRGKEFLPEEPSA